MDLFYALLIVALVLGLVILVGHLMWVILALMIRGRRAGSPRIRTEPLLEDDRAATARCLERLRDRDLIDAPTHARILDALAADVASPAGVGRPGDRDEAAERTEQRTAAVDRYLESVRSAAPMPTHVVDVPEPEPAGARDEELAVQVLFASDAPAPAARPEPPPKATPPRRPLGELIAAFMADRNIRWGELLGGLLIVGCSTALVVSLWAQIESIPILKFLIFTAVTAALFGAGLFVYHRWKIPTTGHVVLLIATLLVPLNMLAFAAFALHGRAAGGSTVAIELVALALFGWLTWRAARVLVGEQSAWFAGGTVVLSACALAVRPLAPLAGGRLVVATLLPTALYLGVTIALEWRRRPRRVDEPAAKRAFTRLGVLSFACLVPLCLALYESGQFAAALHYVAPALCLLAVPAIRTGQRVWRLLDRRAPGHLATSAASVMFVGCGVLLAGLALAWPSALRLLAGAVVAVLVFTYLGRRHLLVRGAALGALAIVVLLAVHLVLGNVSWKGENGAALTRALLSATSGHALVVVVAVALALAHRAYGRGKRRSARAHALGAAAVALASLLLLARYGFGRLGDPQLFVLTCALYAAACFVVARITVLPALTWAGLILGQIALAQAVVYRWPVRELPWATALLVGAAVATASLAVWRIRRPSPPAPPLESRPASQFAVLATTAAAVLLAFDVSRESLGPWSYRAAGIALLWLALAILVDRRALVAAGQAAFAVAAAAATQRYVYTQDWAYASGSILAAPPLWQAHALVLAAQGLGWALLRTALTPPPPAPGSTTIGDSPVTPGWRGLSQRLLRAPLADHVLAGLAVLLLAGLSLRLVLPPVLHEHGARSAERIASVPLGGTLGAWIVLGASAATIVLQARPRVSRIAALGMTLLVGSALALVAARFEPLRHVVTAWRTLAGAALLGLFAAIWSRAWWRPRLPGWARGLLPDLGFPKRELYAVLLGIVGLPAVLLTCTFASSIIGGTAVLPLLIDPFFERLLLFTPPALVVATLFGHGLYERRAAYAGAAALLAAFLVITVESAMRAHRSIVLGYAWLAWLAQLTVFVVAAIGLAWALLLPRIRPGGPVVAFPIALLWPGRALIAALLALATINLWIEPQNVPTATTAAGTLWMFLAAVGLEWALWLAATARPDGPGEHQRIFWIYFAVIPFACLLSRWDTGNWLCYHAVLLGLVLAPAVVLLSSAVRARRLVGLDWRQVFALASARSRGDDGPLAHDLSCRHCGYNLRYLTPSANCPECGAIVEESIAAAAATLTPAWSGRLSEFRAFTTRAVLAGLLAPAVFAVPGVADDPQKPWWEAAAFFALAPTVLGLAGWLPRRAIAYFSALAIGLAVSIAWIVTRWTAGAVSYFANWVDLANLNLVATAAAGAAWLAIQHYSLRRRAAPRADSTPPLHFAAAGIGTALVVLLAVSAFVGAVLGLELTGVPPLTWIAWAAVAALAWACRREFLPEQALLALYLLGLAAIVQLVARAPWSPPTLLVALAIVLATYPLAASALLAVPGLARQLRAADPEVVHIRYRAGGVLAALGAVVAILASVQHPAVAGRLLASVAPAIAGMAVLRGTLDADGRHRRMAALALGAVSAILLAWSLVAPDAPVAWLHRGIGAVAVFAALALLVAWRPADSDGAWHRPISQVSAGLGLLAALALAACAAFEVLCLWQGREAPWTSWAVGMLIIALAALIVCGVVFALRDGLDPLRVPQRFREAYVYAAEWLACLLGLHVRASMPWLFSGFITQYWPLILMGLAFAALAAGELCARRGWQTVGRPLGRTGLFMPALLLVELFLSSSRVHYSIVLLTAGVLYAILAAMRRSFYLAIVSATAFNGSLWYLLYRTPGLGLGEHPQLWLIPPALAVLAADHATRTRLTHQQRSLLHYGCLLAVYLSSTADIFLNGVAQAPWLPLVLAALAVAGVLVGLAVRMRSFLMLGTGFLALAVLTMVYHAAENLGWTWVWYVTGICFGAGLIIVFALLEKKRADIQAWLTNLRTWSG